MPEKPVINPDVLAFPGFDSFNEREFYEFTERLMRNGWHEITLCDRVPNARKPMLDKYKRMIQCWNDAGNPRHPFTKSMVEKLLEARFFVPKHSGNCDCYQLLTANRRWRAKDVISWFEKYERTQRPKNSITPFLHQAAQNPHVCSFVGAREGTRTPTPLLASGPKPGASTNFATLAVSQRVWHFTAFLH